MDVKSELKDFIVSEFGDEHPGLSPAPGDNLFNEGIVDSMGVLQLVNFIEQTYGVKVADEEITLNNFESINAMEKLILGKKG